MPKDLDRREMTQEEIEQEKFKTFFTTSVAQVPEDMINAANRPNRKHGLLARFFAKKEKARAVEEPEEVLRVETPVAPTGEIRLDRPAREKADSSLELAARPSLEELSRKLAGLPPEPPPEPAPAPEPELRLELEPLPEQEPEPVPAPAPAPAPELRAGSIPEPASEPALELELEDEPPQPAPAPQPERAAEPPRPAPQAAPPARTAPAPRQESRKQARRAASAGEDKDLLDFRTMLDSMGPAPARPAATPPEEDREITEQVGGFHFFGVGEDEAPRGEGLPQRPEDTMSLELNEEEPAPQPAPAAAPPAEKAEAPAPDQAEPERPARAARRKGRGRKKRAAHAAPAHAAPAYAERPEEPAQPEQPEQPEQAAAPVPEAEAPAAGEAAPPPPEAAPEAEAPAPEDGARALDQTVATLTLRCALSGILAAALVWAGLIYEGFLPAVAGLDPAAAPAAFMGANLLLLAGALAVSRNILRDGLLGLVKAPSYDTLPALAGAAALLQAAVALLNPDVYQSTSLTMMSGGAALALFLDNLGTRMLAASVRDGGRLLDSGVGHRGAFRAKDKDLIRCLAPTLEEKDPWILLSRPLEGDGGYLAQSFGPRAGEKKAQTIARVLLGCAVAGGVWMLLTGKGPNGAAAAMAAILCLGAPLSSTLIAGLTALRMERTAGAVGAVIPGWAGVEELNGIDTLQVDAGELFTPESAQLEDIRIFKGGRIDRAILYAASVLNQGCNTLGRLFRTIIADRTDILPPVKDLERHTGLGFSGWCSNSHILIGTRAFMEQEGVALPEASYEAKHSRDGELQVLYLAVSGNMYAMFVLRYVGGKRVARSLAALQRENIRLLVTCQDPSLTAERIAAAYRLPEGLVTVLGEAQCTALAAASAPSGEPCCMLHLPGFASLTGGLRAAQRAQAAESAGVAIQLVSAGVSALIGLLLSYSGSIGTLSLLVVLMYQAAWSALGIAAAAMKQHA